MIKYIFDLHKSESRLLVILVFAVMFVFAGWNTDNADIDNYRISYEYLSAERANLLSLDFGYRFLEFFFYRLGLPFENFRLLIYFNGLLFIVWYCKKQSLYPLLALLFYFLFHFLRDSVETRNYIASLFILFSLLFIQRNKTIDKILFYGSIVLSWTVHISFLLYSFLIFTPRNKQINYWICLVISSFLSFVSKPIFGSLASIIKFDGFDNKVEGILSKSPIFATLLCTLLAGVNGLFVSYILKKDLSSENTISHSLFYNINSLSCFLLIFTSISMSFYGRLFGNLLLFNVCYFLSIIKTNKVNFKLILFFIFYVVIFVYFLQIKPFDLHFDYIIHNNSIFDL